MKKYFFSLIYNNERKNINFVDQKIKKSRFYKNKKIFNIDDIDVNKILVSKKEPYGKNNSLIYFIGYNDNDVIRPLCLKLSKMTGYINKFDENKITMSLMIKDIQLLKNYNKIWKKIEKLMKIDFNTKTTYGDDDKYIKTKIKTYADIIITNFHNKKMPKEKVPCKCLSIIMLDSVIESDEKYYPQTFLEECKYVQEKIKFENYINEELDSDSNDEKESNIDNDDDNDSDGE